MNASGKSASLAPPAAASAASPDIFSIVAARSSTTGSAWMHATRTGSSMPPSLRPGELADERVLGLVVELKVLRAARKDLLPVTVARGVEQPLDLPVDRVVPRRHGLVAELALG